MQRRTIAMIFTLVVFFFVEAIHCRDASSRASIRIYLSTTFGEPIGEVLVKLKSLSTSVELKKTGEKIQFDQVPFDVYEVEIQKSNFETRRERVRVSQPEVSLRLGLSVGRTHPEKMEPVEGIVRNWRPDHIAWVRLVPLYHNELIETRIEKTGGIQIRRNRAWQVRSHRFG